MVRITEDLVRKRSEHNECEIFSLEELSLHQQDIEKIEHLDRWCRDLKILYLQSNLIPKIENVSRLKKVEYINLALNNIERVENLEGCESLTKLDLTVNFVGELTSIECLKELVHFRELFLTGNPCTDYEHYRDYVVATLPQLQFLDGVEIEKSERIKAIQMYGEIRPRILEQQERHRKKREKEKLEAKLKEEKENESNPGFDRRWYTDINNSDSTDRKEKTEDEKEKEYWEEKVAFTPESRMQVHQHMQEKRKRESGNKEEEPKQERRLVTEDGRRLNVNEPKVDFSLTEDEDGNSFILDVAVYKYLDTSLCDVDVQPTYVQVILKGKLLQLTLEEEVNADKSTAKRSQVTGHLVITMPKAKQIIKPQKSKKASPVKTKEKENNKTRHEKLEVTPNKAVDISNIVSDKTKSTPAPLGSTSGVRPKERANSEDFVDDPDVPPLM